VKIKKSDVAKKNGEKPKIIINPKEVKINPKKIIEIQHNPPLP
jgi:hypothetical protein